MQTGAAVRRLARGSVLALLLCAPGPAFAESLQFQGTLSLHVVDFLPVVFYGAADAEVSGLPAAPRVALAASAFAGQVAVPITDPLAFPIVSIFGAGANQAGVFERPASGEAIGGAVALAGFAKVCLYAACTENPVANVTVPLSLIGRDASGHATGPVNLTVIGAPWTTGDLPPPNSVMGGASADADSVSLNLVTPIFISSNLAAFPRISAYAQIQLFAGTECENGEDDDGDGFIDFPADPSCTAATDPSERDLGDACRNGIDDDGDGLADHPADPGCFALQDGDESDAYVACDNGRDDDSDGRTDMLDSGCDSPADVDEAEIAAGACADAVDQDGDGLVAFPLDPGCASLDDEDERGDLPCDDQADEDLDAFAAYPGDPGCIGPAGPNEQFFSLACDDGRDQDGDGLPDFSFDPLDCSSPADPAEGVHLAECANGYDDDDDGRIDAADGGCTGPDDTSEDVVFPPFGVGVVQGGDPLWNSDESLRVLGAVRLLPGAVIGHRLHLDGELASTLRGGALQGGSVGGDLVVRTAFRVLAGEVLGALRTYASARVEVSGGQPGTLLEVADASRVTLYVADPGARPLGPVPEVTGTIEVTLYDGTPLSIPFLREPTARIEITDIPEPGATLAVSTAFAALARLAGRRACRDLRSGVHASR